MKASKMRAAFSITIGLFFLAASAAQARSNDLAYPSNLKNPEPAPVRVEREYDYQAFITSWGISPDMLINCDPQGDLLMKAEPGSAQTYHSLQSGVCSNQAQSLEISETPDLASASLLSADQVNTVDSACKDCSNAAVVETGTAASGESNILKINPAVTEVKYVYLQCGKKVATFGPQGCSCSSNWHYNNNCQKPKTVFITIPCH
jgi:hypothetical protein